MKTKPLYKSLKEKCLELNAIIQQLNADIKQSIILVSPSENSWMCIGLLAKAEEYLLEAKKLLTSNNKTSK